MIRLFIVDDHPITCDGLAEWLPMKEEDIEVVGTAYSGWDALEKIETLQPDVVLLDCKLPDIAGLAVVKEISLQGWPVKVLAFSGYSDWETVGAMLQAGAKGYLLKMEKRETILDAIRAVARGETWFSQPINMMLMQQIVQEEETLTAREMDVLRLLAQGLTSKQIAIQLQIGPRTVETHIGKIYQKLKAQNKGNAVRIAGEKGLLR
ncbi:MAG: response regulator transcription factor [Anaerolineales bacterium]